MSPCMPPMVWSQSRLRSGSRPLLATQTDRGVPSLAPVLRRLGAVACDRGQGTTGMLMISKCRATRENYGSTRRCDVVRSPAASTLCDTLEQQARLGDAASGAWARVSVLIVWSQLCDTHSRGSGRGRRHDQGPDGTLAVAQDTLAETCHRSLDVCTGVTYMLPATIWLVFYAT